MIGETAQAHILLQVTITEYGTTKYKNSISKHDLTKMQYIIRVLEHPT